MSLPVGATHDICAICREELPPGQAEVLPCGHGFHGGCVRPWLRTQPECPLCRSLTPPGPVDVAGCPTLHEGFGATFSADVVRADVDVVTRTGALNRLLSSTVAPEAVHAAAVALDEALARRARLLGEATGVVLSTPVDAVFRWRDDFDQVWSLAESLHRQTAAGGPADPFVLAPLLAFCDRLPPVAQDVSRQVGALASALQADTLIDVSFAAAVFCDEVVPELADPQWTATEEVAGPRDWARFASVLHDRCVELDGYLFLVVRELEVHEERYAAAMRDNRRLEDHLAVVAAWLRRTLTGA
ncbi:hypothetical protein UK23_38300 [Lentzea aerocolonigenes]|uniref:RING-type domain-containing protein n=1 Tax=Lentzea aerocolonigenes TaxID=68170 RepID=A0A0F0GFR5_LENAE|nr:RING-H2 finger protein [Lentzea aerocolonigenes]KJK42190.1 hypothetical protein UK23_38300 [Lentzea aerocolonigenes]